MGNLSPLCIPQKEPTGDWEDVVPYEATRGAPATRWQAGRQAAQLRSTDRLVSGRSSSQTANVAPSACISARIGARRMWSPLQQHRGIVGSLLYRINSILRSTQSMKKVTKKNCRGTKNRHTYTHVRTHLVFTSRSEYTLHCFECSCFLGHCCGWRLKLPLPRKRSNLASLETLRFEQQVPVIFGLFVAGCCCCCCSVCKDTYVCV